MYCYSSYKCLRNEVINVELAVRASPPSTIYFDMMNSSDTNVSSVAQVVVGTATNSVSVLVCLLAAILVLILRLYKKVVYRLALYQVLASLALATVATLQEFIYIISFHRGYDQECIAMGWFLLYTEWMKLLFTMWVTFHLFCFAVLHKNLKKLEVLYVVTSLLVPAVIACVPLITRTYGRSPDGTYCYIYVKDKENSASIERFALWDGPAMIILSAASTAMVVMVIKVTGRACLRSKYEPITDGDQFWKALKQLLPLAAFPILFLIFEIPIFIFHVYATASSKPNMALNITQSVFFSLWSMTSGGTLLVHIFVVRYWTIKSFINNNFIPLA